MSEYFDIDLSPNHISFGLATDAERMLRRFEERLYHVWHKQYLLRGLLITRVFPRENDGFAIQYQLTVFDLQRNAAKRLLLYGHLLGRDEPWPDYAAEANPMVFTLPDLRLVVPVFPYDPALGKLPAFYEASPEMLDGVTAYLDVDTPEVVDCEVLSYRLERRCVFAYTIGAAKQDRIVAKLYRRRRMRPANEILAQMNNNGFDRDSADGLTVPRPYHADLENDALFMEAVPGRSLHAMLASQDFPRACSAAGRLLAKLHSMPLLSLPDYSFGDELQGLDARIDLVSRVYPRLREPYLRLYEALRAPRQFPLDLHASTTIHRDFYDKQVAYAEKRTSLLDTDSMVIGDPAQDYGNFVAHLILRRMQSPVAQYGVGKGLRAFKEAYGNNGGDFEMRTHWWQAATLTRLAALYALRPRWRNLVPELLARAEKSLAESESNIGGIDAVYSI